MIKPQIVQYVYHKLLFINLTGEGKINLKRLDVWIKIWGSVYLKKRIKSMKRDLYFICFSHKEIWFIEKSSTQ